MESLIQFNNIKQEMLPKIQIIKLQKLPETKRRRSNSLPQLQTKFQQSLYFDTPNPYYSNNLYIHEYV